MKMKRIWILLLATVMLLACLVGCSPESLKTPQASETPSPDYTFELREAGVRFELPEDLRDLKGTLQPAYGYELVQGSGIYLSALVYAAMPDERYDELIVKGPDLSEEDLTYLQSRMIEIFYVYTVGGGRSLEDLGKFMAQFGLSTAHCKMLGSVGEYHFYYDINPLRDYVESLFVFDEGFREEYEAILPLLDSPSWIRISEPEQAAAPEGKTIMFKTTDLEGNTVRSEDIFHGHTLTMLNLWGTYCGPCIREMPDLERLRPRLESKNCSIVGIVLDVPDLDSTEMVATAREILAQTGVTYLNLIPWPGLETQLPSQFIPTSYFVDSEGRIVGEAAVGARGAEE